MRIGPEAWTRERPANFDARPALQTVVVKVPVSSGSLLGSATLLARLGLSGALGQLYQIGTYPPHYNSFSSRSLRLLPKSCGLIPVEELRDLDFEPRLLPDRVHLLAALPGAVKAPLSLAALAPCRLSTSVPEWTGRPQTMGRWPSPGCSESCRAR